MPPIELFVTRALTQVGNRYVYGAKVSGAVLDPKASGLPMDCSGLVSWAAASCGVTVPEGSWGQFQACRIITVEEGINTRGALLGIPANGSEHVAISLGNGTTIEEHDTASGCGIYSATGRFSIAGILPGFTYTTPTQQGDPPVTPADAQLLVNALFTQMQATDRALKGTDTLTADQTLTVQAVDLIVHRMQAIQAVKP
jgi:hypothetical protein